MNTVIEHLHFPRTQHLCIEIQFWPLSAKPLILRLWLPLFLHIILSLMPPTFAL